MQIEKLRTDYAPSAMLASVVSGMFSEKPPAPQSFNPYEPVKPVSSGKFVGMEGYKLLLAASKAGVL